MVEWTACSFAVDLSREGPDERLLLSGQEIRDEHAGLLQYLVQPRVLVQAAGPGGGSRNTDVNEFTVVPPVRLPLPLVITVTSVTKGRTHCAAFTRRWVGAWSSGWVDFLRILLL
jgi:hypothetical protein